MEGIDEVSLPYWATALGSMVDSEILMVLRDSRILVGFFRSYDQFANVLLEKTRERHVVNGAYADIPLGTMVIRGENIAMFGEVDSALFEEKVRRCELQSVFAMEEQAKQMGVVDLGFLDEQ